MQNVIKYAKEAAPLSAVSHSNADTGMKGENVVARRASVRYHAWLNDRMAELPTVLTSPCRLVLTEDAGWLEQIPVSQRRKCFPSVSNVNPRVLCVYREDLLWLQHNS